MPSELPNVMPAKSAEKMRLELPSMERHIIVADINARNFRVSISELITSFTSTVICPDFLEAESIRYDLINGASALVKMRAYISIYLKTVTTRKNAKTEVLNLLYKPETLDGSDNQQTTDSETNIREDSSKKIRVNLCEI